MLNRDDLLGRLAAENPIREDDLQIPAEHRDRLFHSISVRSGGTHRRAYRTPRRQKLTMAIALALMATLVLGGAAIGGGTNIMGRFLLDDNDIPAEITDTQRITPLPPGYVWDSINYETEGQKYEVGVFVNVVQGEAQCKWLTYWQDARQRGDTAAVATAMGTIRDMPNWKMYVENFDPQSRDWFISLVNQAVAGNPTGLDQIAYADCSGAPPVSH